jgi:hypothetical protein
MQSTFVASAALAAVLCTLQGRADVMEADAHSASIRIVVPVSATPAKAYESFLQIGKWWDKEHTFSGDSARLKLNPTAGGCFCESLPDGGSVLHLTVVNVVPNRSITLSGALGPLQAAGIAGGLSISFAPKDAGAEVVLVYNLGGYYPNGLQSIAPAVNEVLQHQMQRLQQFTETGKAGRDAQQPSPP